MKKYGILGMTLCLLICLFAGCTKPKPDKTTSPDDADIGTDKALIHVDVTTLFTTEEIGEILNTEVSESTTTFESDTAVTFLTADGYQVTVLSVMEFEREAFDEMVFGYVEAETTPHLGEVAYWVSAGGDMRELLVFDSGYAVSVQVTVEGMIEDHTILAARQIAALTLERIFA